MSTSNPSSDRPTCEMTPEQLLGLVRHTRAKTTTKDLAPEIEIVAVGTQKSQPLGLVAPPAGFAPADDVAQVTAPPPIAPPAPYVMPPLPPPALYVAPALPPATTAVRLPTEPGPLGAIIGFALVALAFAVGAYIAAV